MQVDGSEEEVSAMSDQTCRMINTITSHHNNSSNTSTAHDNKDHSIEITVIEMIDEITKEFLADKRSKLREINQMNSRITEILNFQH